MKYIAGFIGCGNMGGALARAAISSVGADNIAVCDPDKTKTDLLTIEYGVTVLDSKEIISECEYVFIGVKPQMMESVLAPLIDIINSSSSVLVTMAAGLELFYYQNILKISRPTIRIMPNTPCAIGEGMILYDMTDGIDSSVEKGFINILSKAGKIDKIPERLIDAGSAVSGCGPAFAFIFAEALADAGVECGLPRDKALLYAAQMLKGSAALLIEKGNPGALKDAVCSPGGTTIAGVHALENNAFRAAAMNAVLAAYRKNLELK